MTTSERQNDFEQKLVNQLAAEMLAEQRRNRRWGIFFKLILVLYLLAFLLMLDGVGEELDLVKPGGHTALIEVNGVIADGGDVNAEDINAGLRDAFEQEEVEGVVLRINSPGGSPVQAGYVHDEILRLRQESPGRRVYAVITDRCASGCYYIAAATDEIYADKASIVGSIGVVMDSFGFVGSLEKLGIERRLLHAGEHKGLLDPFSPLQPDQVAHIQKMLEQVHEQFKAVVLAGRGERLKAGEEVFSGLIWTGEQALEMGLVDGLADARYVAREVIGAEEILDYTVHEEYWQGLLSRFASRMGTALGEGIHSRLLLQ